MDAVHVVPVEFWYSSCLILIAVLIWIFQRFMNKLDKQLDEFKMSIQDLTLMVKLHDKDIKELKESKGRRSRG